MSEKKSIIKISSDISKYGINNIHNKEQVIYKVVSVLENSFLSNENQVKPIKNINTGIHIEIWKSGIRETFGNDKYYMSLPVNIKIAKIASMSCLGKLIKYAKLKANNISNYHNPKSKIKYMYLENSIIIDSIEYIVTIDVRILPKGINRFYIHNLKIKRREPSKPHSDLLTDSSLI